MKITKPLATLLFAYLSLFFFSQENTMQADWNFTFDEALSYAVEHNYDVQNAIHDIEIANKQKWETIADGLPQINGTVSYQNLLKPGVIVFGDMSVQQSPEQTLMGKVGWDQLIFSGSYLVGIQSVKVYQQISELAKQKTAIEIKEITANAYCNAIVAKENISIIEKNILVAKKNLFETSESYKAGFVEEQSVEQLQLTVFQLGNGLNKATRLIEIAENNLKFIMGIPIEQAIVLETTLDNLISNDLLEDLDTETFSLEDNVDYQIAKNEIASNELQVKYEKTQALPSISGNLSYNYSQNWESKYDYQSVVLGVGVNVPLFSSFKRRAQREKAELNLEKSLINNEKISEQLLLNVKTQQTNYQSALETYDIAKENMALAQRIYQKESIKYTEGISTSNDLAQVENQYYSAQSEYISAISDLTLSKIALDKALNKY